MHYCKLLLQFTITQNTFLINVSILAFYSTNYRYSAKEESTLHVWNLCGISVPSRLVELRFRIIRLQGKSYRTFCRGYLLLRTSFVLFFSPLSLRYSTARRIFAFINTLFREFRKNRKRDRM